MQRLQNNPTRGKRPLAKVKGSCFNKILFLQEKQNCRLEDKDLFIYRNHTTFQKSQIVAFTFLYFQRKKFPLSKVVTAVPTAGISFYKSLTHNNSFKAYKRHYKSKGEGRENLRILFIIFSKLSYSPSLSSNFVIAFLQIFFNKYKV